MKKLTVLLLSLLCFCSSAFATNWQWVCSTSEITVSIDTDTIAKIGSAYTSWIKVVPLEYAQRTIYGEKAAMILEQYSYTKTDLGADCKRLQAVYYNKSGNVIYHNTERQNWSSLIPNSVGEIVYKKTVELANANTKSAETK